MFPHQRVKCFKYLGVCFFPVELWQRGSNVLAATHLLSVECFPRVQVALKITCNSIIFPSFRHHWHHAHNGLEDHKPTIQLQQPTRRKLASHEIQIHLAKFLSTTPICSMQGQDQLYYENKIIDLREGTKVTMILFSWIQSTVTNSERLGDNSATLVNHDLKYLLLNSRNECLYVLCSL
jgi:hypothetical protein